MADEHQQKVVQLGHVKEDNRLVSPENCLLDSLDLLRSGLWKANKLIVIAIDTTDDNHFGLRFNPANVKASEIVAACEILKDRMLAHLNER